MRNSYVRTGGVTEVIHGRRIVDGYRALEDRYAAVTRSWLAEQRDLFDTFCAERLDTVRPRARMAELSPSGVVRPPRWHGSRCFALRQPAGQGHARLCVADAGAEERVLLDTSAIDPSGATSLDRFEPSPDGGLMAYQLSENGSEYSELLVVDVATGESLDGTVGYTRYSSVAWLPDQTGFYYVGVVPADPASSGQATPPGRAVFFHRIGTSGAEDSEVVAAQRDPAVRYVVSVSQDGRWLIVSATRAVARSNSLWLADLSEGGPRAPRLVPVQGEADATSSLSIAAGGPAFSVTTWRAARGRLCAFDPACPDQQNWRELIAERPDALMCDAKFLSVPDSAGMLAVSWLRRGVSEVTLHDRSSGAPLGRLELPGTGTVSELTVRANGGHEMWFNYVDSAHPPRVYHYDALADRLVLWSESGAVLPGPVTRHEVCTSPDGARVGMLITFDPSAGRAPRPLWMTGYGGFGVPATPSYSAETAYWLESGGVHVQVQPRGGGESGAGWHRAGQREFKKNAVQDFNAAAEWLISEGWTTPGQLGFAGSSNGGLMAAAAVTQRPELYAAAVFLAPLTDMVRYELSGLGQLWREEYGSAQDAEQLGWLLSYSPYHHVVDGVEYPAVLLVGFDNDTRVDPLHARKMCAALQDATAGDLPVLFRSDGSGHGNRTLDSLLDLMSEVVAFLALHTGLGAATRERSSGADHAVAAEIGTAAQAGGLRDESRA